MDFSRFYVNSNKFDIEKNNLAISKFYSSIEFENIFYIIKYYIIFLITFLFNEEFF
jgi:hypothetical protein